MSTTYPKSMQEAMPDRDRVAEASAKLGEAGVKYVFSNSRGPYFPFSFRSS